MEHAFVTFKSRALGRCVSYCVALPDAQVAGPGPYAVLYQLHGRSDDHQSWMIRTNLFRYASTLPLIVVTPDGSVAFWQNLGVRERYEDFIIQDLMPHVAQTFHVRPGKAAIGGNSMGGYGALRFGLLFPELFGSVWAHSAALFDRAAMEPYIPGASSLDSVDIYLIATQAAGKDLPVISFDCGTDDRLLTHNRRFQKHLQELGIAHSYYEHPGGHNWDYWDIHVREALAQHAQVLGLTK